MAFCGNCGEQIPEGKNFCPSCGQPISGDLTVEQVETAAAGEAPQTEETTPAEEAPQAGEAAAQAEATTAQAETTASGEAPQAAPAGQPSDQKGQQLQQNLQQGVDKLAQLARDAADETSEYDPGDIEKNKTMGGLAYFLFFLPLIACPDSKYGRFHANQGLLLLCAGLAVYLARILIYTILTWRLLWLASLLSLVITLPVVAVGIIGLINGFSGKAKELPVIGKYRLIK